MKKGKEIAVCIKCNESLPFSSNVNDNTHNIYNREMIASEEIKSLFKGINEVSNDQTENIRSNNEFDLSPIIDCKYIDVDSFKMIKKEKSIFSIIHLNIASLKRHKVELETLLTNLEFKFDIIGISETKIKISPEEVEMQVTPETDYDISLPGYKHFSTPTESDKGGVILYILDKHNCIPRKPLDKIMYKSHVLESVFAEIVLPRKKNIIVGCIYRHPSMLVKDFN